MLVVVGLLCALDFCDDCSADVRGSDAIEGIKALHCTGVVLMHPVTILQVSLRIGSILRAWHDLLHAGQAHSAVEKHKASADVRSVLG